MDIERILIKVAEGSKIAGYSVKGEGVDGKGRYKDILTPFGQVARLYMYKENPERALFRDYNALHHYRRPGDALVLYFNQKTGDYYILAVKPSDDLEGPPWFLRDAFVVSEETLTGQPAIGYKGIVLATDEYISLLEEKGVLSAHQAEILRRARKNVGFHL